MMMKPIKPILLLGIVLILGVSACKSVIAGPTSETPLPTMAPTAQTQTLATPYAMQPAAGICASFEGEIVEITLNADVPDPRCSEVRPDQKLRVINHTQSKL